MEKIRLYFIRHGRQESRLCNVDVPLDEAGRRQSVLAGKRLKGYGIGIIYSSHLIRAKETAEIMNRQLGVTHICLEGLEEIRFGALTGLSDSQIKEKYADFLEERDKYEEDIPFPGAYKNIPGENGKMVFERAKRAIDEIIADCIDKKIEAAAIVSHGGTIRCITAGLLGMPQQHRLLFAKTMENTGITQIDYHIGNKIFYVERINDYAHIENYPELLRREQVQKF